MKRDKCRNDAGEIMVHHSKTKEAASCKNSLIVTIISSTAATPDFQPKYQSRNNAKTIIILKNTTYHNLTQTTRHTRLSIHYEPHPLGWAIDQITHIAGDTCQCPGW